MIKDAYKTNCIFEEDWWLDCVAPGEWEAVTVEKGGHLVARMPVVKRKGRWGMTVLGMPPLTQTLGPWIKPSDGKYAKQRSWEKSIIEDLVSQLPDFDQFNMNFHPSFQNWLPFYWQGYAQTTRYTYVLDDVSDIDTVWNGFLSRVRTDIKKAEKENLIIRDDLGVDVLLSMMDKTFSRQDMDVPHMKRILPGLHEKALGQDAMMILSAEDTQGRIHASSGFVWDERCAYYLVSGADPELRNSGAQSLLLWEAIKRLSGKTKQFDFEGSMNPAIERFFRAYGGTQTPYFNIKGQKGLKANLAYALSSVKSVYAHR